MTEFDIVRVIVMLYGLVVAVISLKMYRLHVRQGMGRIRRKIEFRLTLSRLAYVAYGIGEVAARIGKRHITVRTFIIAILFSISLSALLSVMLLDQEVHAAMTDELREEEAMGFQKFGTGEVIPPEDGDRVVEFDDEDQQALAREGAAEDEQDDDR